MRPHETRNDVDNRTATLAAENARLKAELAEARKLVFELTSALGAATLMLENEARKQGMGDILGHLATTDFRALIARAKEML